MRKQFVSTLSKLFPEDKRLTLLLGDIGVFGFRDLFSKYPDRTFNIGILEQTTVSLASGLSMSGLIPVVHTIAPFLTERAYEQIKVDLGYQKVACNLVSVGSSYDYAALGCTHHCPADVPILSRIPDLQILVPGHQKEFDSLFLENYDNERVSYFRLSETTNSEANISSEGKNILIKEGGDILIIAVGPMLQRVVEACSGIDATILYCTSVKPFDHLSVQENLKKKILIIEPYYSGVVLSSLVSSFDGLKADLSCLGVPDNFIHSYGNSEDIDKEIGLDVKSIREIISKKIND